MPTNEDKVLKKLKTLSGMETNIIPTAANTSINPKLADL
jgi:hypothetical protein